MKKRLLLAVTAAAAMAASGCTDIPDIEPEGCGNLVLNVDEDCDGFAGVGDNTACGDPSSDNACFFICDETDGTVCPDGWGCGSDGRCRRPSGSFEPGPGSPYRFRVGDFEVGDIDGDGVNDLVGNDVQAVTARFGSDSGELADEFDVLTPEPFGQPNYGFFDGDNLLDVVVPVGAGLFVLLGDEERALDPVAYSPFEVELPPGGARIVPVESDGGANLNTELLIVVGAGMEFLGSNAATFTLPMGCTNGQCTATDVAGNVPVANIDDDPEGRSEFALAFRQTNAVWVYTTAGDLDEGSSDLQPVVSSTVLLPTGNTIDQGAYLTDVDGDGDEDLIVSMRNALNRPKIGVAIGNGAGGFGLLLPREVFDRGMDGDSVWPIAVGNFGGDAKADYVYPDFIGVSDFSGPGSGVVGIPQFIVPTQFITNATWTEGAIGDFNDDGSLDVATVVEGAEGVDVFLNAAATGVFNKFHIDTDNPPRNLRVSDYDGDFVADLAFAESGFGAVPDALSVIFGSTSGGPSDPVQMGELGFVEILEPVSSVTSPDSIDVIADLFVLTSSFPDRETTAVAVLQGSSSRRMLSPFTLQDPDGQNPDIPRAALFGNFSPDSDGIRDVVAVADVAIDFDGTEPGGGDLDLTNHLWFVPGTGGDGQLDAGGAGFVTLPDSTAFDTGCAVWTSGDINGEEPEEIVAIDNGSECYGFGFSPAPRLFAGNLVGGDTPFNTSAEELNTTARAVRQVELKDLDGDGDNDLLALFEGEVRAGNTGGGAIDGAAVVVIWNIDGALSLSSTSTITFSNGAQLFDVDAIHLDDTGIPGLAILATGGVYVARLDVMTTTYGEPTRLLPQFGDGRLEVGDLNADGLDDIAYTAGDDVFLLLARTADPVGATLGQPVATEGGQP